MKKAVTYSQPANNYQLVIATRAEFAAYDNADESTKRCMERHIKRRYRAESEPRYVATVNTDIDKENMPRKDRTVMRQECKAYGCMRPARVRADWRNKIWAEGYCCEGCSQRNGNLHAVNHDVNWRRVKAT